jgi:pimeloyl-ACP methyl ester carboxylesterase
MSLRFFPLFLLSVPYVILAEPLPAKELEVIHQAPSANMDRADLYFVLPIDHPKAVLVLSPGVNVSGESLIRSPAWQQFAQQNHLGLVGLSFSSPEKMILDGTGYYYASKGSGEKLLEGIRKIYGKDLPLLLYGFSGGAHFTSRFEEWAPSRVIAWCADSAGWWDEPKLSAITPPGIVACGENDPRYGASLSYFKQGRAAGKPWLPAKGSGDMAVM